MRGRGGLTVRPPTGGGADNNPQGVCSFDCWQRQISMPGEFQSRSKSGTSLLSHESPGRAAALTGSQRKGRSKSNYCPSDSTIMPTLGRWHRDSNRPLARDSGRRGKGKVPATAFSSGAKEFRCRKLRASSQIMVLERTRI